MKHHLDELTTKGFTILPNILTPSECDFYKSSLEKNYQQYSALHANEASSSVLANKIGEKVVYNLHNKDLAWFKLFEHKAVTSLLDVILREGSYSDAEPYYLNNISARSPLKGFPDQQLHLDSNLPGVNYCLTANVLWYFDDSHAMNGATRVVPGSHKWMTYAPDGQKHPEEIVLSVKKGSVCVFNANLWHAGGANQTDGTRWALALGYTRWFVKPSFDFMRNTPAHIYDKLTEAQKDLLGFRLVPPQDEFTRLRRRSRLPETPEPYSLPSGDS